MVGRRISALWSQSSRHEAEQSAARLDLKRRRLLQTMAAGGALVGLAGPIGRLAWARASHRGPADYPFTLGVASGDPLPHGVVLWTRLAPDPLFGGAMMDKPVVVGWEVAEDESFRHIVRRGVEVALPRWGHAVHVELWGLKPGRWYWYRFHTGLHASPVGRTRTAPSPLARTKQLNLAFASCQHYEAGYYAAYRHMARDDLDMVLHLGDYIYEGTPGAGGARTHEGTGEPLTVEDYRNRHAQYRSDPDLQSAHAAFPFIVTWDDHEVDNNWAGDIPQDPEQQPRSAFLARRAAAFQAYYEHMPLRLPSRPRRTGMGLFRDLRFGDLAAINVLDGRQYRSDQPCRQDFPSAPDCPDRHHPSLTMLGRHQRAWLTRNLRRSPTRWNVLANQTIFAPFDYDPAGGQAFNMDQWDGYPAERQQLLDLFASGRVRNPVVLTGDWHSSWVNELRHHGEDPASPVVGTEFVGTSIASPCSWAPAVAAALSANPHVRMFDGDRRGYVRCRLTAQAWHSDYVLLPPLADPRLSVPNPQVPVDQIRSYVIPDGGVVTAA